MLKLEGRKYGSDGDQLQGRTKDAAPRVPGWPHLTLGDLSPAWSPRRVQGLRGRAQEGWNKEKWSGSSYNLTEVRTHTLCIWVSSPAKVGQWCFRLWRFSKIYLKCVAHENRHIIRSHYSLYDMRLNHVKLWIS